MKIETDCNNTQFKGRVKFLTPKEMHNSDLRPLIHHLKYHAGGKNVLHEISLDGKTLRVNSTKTTDGGIFEKFYTCTAIDGKLNTELGVKKVLEMINEAAISSKKSHKSENNSTPFKKLNKHVKVFCQKFFPHRFFKSSPTL